MTGVVLRAGAATDVGRLRTINQDRYVLLPDRDLFVVADGMGGHQGGEVASRLAIETLQVAYQEPTADALTEAIAVANHRIRNEGDADPHLRGMGTTVVALARHARGARPRRPVDEQRTTTPTREHLAHRQRRRQPRLPATATARSCSSPRTTASSPTWCARAASPPRRRRSTRSATSSPGCSASTRPSTSTSGRSTPSPATASCCAPTACSTRWAPTRSAACCAGSTTHRGRRRAGAPRQRGRRPRQHHRGRRRRRRRRRRRGGRIGRAGRRRVGPRVARSGRELTTTTWPGFTTAMPVVDAAGLSDEALESVRAGPPLAEGAAGRARKRTPRTRFTWRVLFVPRAARRRDRRRPRHHPVVRHQHLLRDLRRRRGRHLPGPARRDPLGRARARGAHRHRPRRRPRALRRRDRGRQRAAVAGRGAGRTSPTSSATSRSSRTARATTTTTTRPGSTTSTTAGSTTTQAN